MWDGSSFVFTQNEGDSFWWGAAKLVYRYGLAPIRTQRLMKKTVGKFLQMYEAPYFPFRSLTQTVYELGLTEATAATGEEFLEANGIGGKFPQELIQASTRVNYASNLALIHGLETMVCMAAEGAMAVQGGNWQIFQGMVKASGAEVTLGEEVSGIERHDDGTLTLSSESFDGQDSANYDQVILAAPYQFSNLTISPALESPPDKIPYVELHVTLFASPHKLSPAYFGLSADRAVPEFVLTTLPESFPPPMRDDPNGGTGPAGFYSASVVRYIPSTTPKDPPQYVYKIFSPKPVDASLLARLLNIRQTPRDVNFDAAAQGANGEEGGQSKEHTTFQNISTLPKEDVSWSYEKVWYSYPREYPRITFEDLQLADGLWYTSGIESFISTMETSSLMGKNIARLIADSWSD